MQRDPRFSRRWGFMGYGSTPLHYPLHPSIDRRCCIGVVQRHYTMPGPVVSLCHGSPMHAWLVTGFMKESSRLDLHASKYRVEQQNFRSSETTSVFERRRKERRGRRGGGEGNMDHLRGNVSRIVAKYRTV